jgi:hypothetical protein
MGSRVTPHRRTWSNLRVAVFHMTEDSLAIRRAGLAVELTARSPVGQALMGRRAGDVVSAELPAGGIESLRIVAIMPPLAAEAA